MHDNLRQPLKRRTFADRLKRLKPSTLQVASVVAGGTIFATLGWFYFNDVPFAGEPVVTAKISPLEKLSTATTPKQPDGGQATDTKTGNNEIPPEPDPADLAADRAAAARQKVAIIQRPGRLTARPLRRAPVRAVSQRSPFGLIPKIAKNGKRPFDVYSARIKSSVINSGKPKIAIVLGGMGINSKLTHQAIKELPGHITFAFAPYGKGLQGMINKARGRGHEVVLHLPMEPFGYPSVNPGPKTLLASAEPADNLKNLQWLMSRFSGYNGVTNYMGAKFTSDGGALLPVFSQLKSRGLVYFDDSSNGAALTESIAQAVKLPTRTADIVINGDQTFTAIQQTLVQLENIARAKGMAIATGTGLASTIDALEAWSRELEDRGFLLVPLSVAYRRVRS